MEKDGLATSSDTSIEKEGFISQSLSKDGIPNQSLSDDHIGIENIAVEPNKLYEAVLALRNYGFNYLQCQGGYDEGPGKNLVSFYHFITVDDLKKIETIMNTLSVTLDFPKLIISGGQIDIREDVNQRISNIIDNIKTIDSDIDQAMDGWRLKRLPRIDRDILRLAYVDINFLNTPIAVACDEAVNLANKYSDLQGRKFINGVLRRLQTS